MGFIVIGFDSSGKFESLSGYLVWNVILSLDGRIIVGYRALVLPLTMPVVTHRHRRDISIVMADHQRSCLYADSILIQ